MNPIEVRLARLAELGFRFLPAESGSYVFLERDGFVALVERTADGLGRPGSSGILTSRGFAALVWRGGNPVFVLKNFEQPATPGEVADLRLFAADLEEGLR